MNLVTRVGTEADATALAELAACTFHDTFAVDNRPEDMALHIAQSYGAAQQARELSHPEISTLLVDVDGQLAGYAQLRSGVPPASVPRDASLELWRFYVAREWHGRGIAQELMQGVIAEAQRRGGRSLWLGVWEKNARAKAFYAKSGFVDVGSHMFMLGSDAQTDRILVRHLSTVIADVSSREHR